MNLGSILKGSYWKVLSRGLSLSELCFEMGRKGTGRGWEAVSGTRTGTVLEAVAEETGKRKGNECHQVFST